MSTCWFVCQQTCIFQILEVDTVSLVYNFNKEKLWGSIKTFWSTQWVQPTHQSDPMFCKSTTRVQHSAGQANSPDKTDTMLERFSRRLECAGRPVLVRVDECLHKYKYKHKHKHKHKYKYIKVSPQIGMCQKGRGKWGNDKMTEVGQSSVGQPMPAVPSQYV